MADAGAVVGYVNETRVDRPLPQLGFVVSIMFRGTKHDAKRAWHHIPREGDWVDVGEVVGQIKSVTWADDGVTLDIYEMIRGEPR